MARQPKAKEKPITAERPKSIVLTEKQDKFVNAILDGKDRVAAAVSSGYGYTPSVPEKSMAVQEALRAARDELSSAAQITRADVIDGFMEAINLARLAADPASMIKGWAETAKVLGLYAPEVKRLEITDNQKRIQSKYEAMTDEDLLKIIDSTSERVDD